MTRYAEESGLRCVDRYRTWIDNKKVRATLSLIVTDTSQKESSGSVLVTDDSDQVPAIAGLDDAFGHNKRRSSGAAEEFERWLREVGQLQCKDKLTS